MKTDLIEIFQTIRANLQPYTANGFTARVNSENVYELWSEKLFDTEGEKIEAVPFASVKIEEDYVQFCLLSTQSEVELSKIIHPDLMELSVNDTSCFNIISLDDKILDQLTSTLGANFTDFKQNGWV